MLAPSRVRLAFALLTLVGAGIAAWALVDARSVTPAVDLGPELGPGAALTARAARGDAGVAGLRGAVPVEGPRTGRLAWRHATGGRITGPAAADAAGVYVSSHDGHLHALDHDGRLRWTRPLGAASYSGVVAGATGLLWVGTEDGVLRAFDARGEERVRIATPSPVDRPPAPWPGGGVLYVSGSQVGRVSADGVVGGRFSAHRKVFSRPRVDAGGVYFGAQDHRLYALDPALALRWYRDLGVDVDSGPGLGPGGQVVVGADDGRVHAFGADGTALWSVALQGAVRSRVQVTADGRVALQVHGVMPSVVCLSLSDGRLVYRHRLSREDWPGAGSRSGPLVDAAGVVYAGTHDDRIVAIAPDGSLLFQVATRGHVNADPLLAPDGTLYVGADDGVLYAIRD